MAHPVHLVSGTNRNQFATSISAMHADRKTVFIDQLKWKLPISDGQFEIDDYDGPETLYLIVEDAVSGGHLGSVRLLPSNGPHLLADKFAHLCADGVPRGDDIYEITRLVTRPGLGRAEAEHVREQLSVAIIEFGLARGITNFTMMTHMAFLSAVIAVGWDCEPLGLPHDVDGVAVGALSIAVNTTTLARLRRQWNFGEPVLRLDLSRSALAA